MTQGPQTDAQLAQSLKEFVDALKAGSDFVMEQAPLVVQEKLFYGRITETLLFLALLVASVVVAKLAPRWWRWEPDDSAMKEISAIVGAVATIGLVGSVIGQSSEVLKVWLAPRLYILEWATDLVR